MNSFLFCIINSEKEFDLGLEYYAFFCIVMWIMKVCCCCGHIAAIAAKPRLGNLGDKVVV